LAKISAGFFFLRISGVMTAHRIVTYIVTSLAALIGCLFFFVSMFQCTPVDFFWTRLSGRTDGRCINMQVMMHFTYLFGSVTAATDIAYGVLVAVLTWNLNVDRRTKMLIAPLLGLTCVYVKGKAYMRKAMLTTSSASYAALVRMPYIENFRRVDFLCKLASPGKRTYDYR
jgi:uncharacterized membrane protein YuzA (DUF378 family)